MARDVSIYDEPLQTQTPDAGANTTGTGYDFMGSGDGTAGQIGYVYQDMMGINPVQSDYAVDPYRIESPTQVGDIAAWQGLAQGAGTGLTEDRTAAMAATSLGAANLTYLDQAQQGQVPSAAELQAQAQLEQAQRAALAQAATGRGGGGQQRAAILAGQQTGLEAVMQGAALRAQEQAQARDAYLQGLGLQGQLAANQAGISDQGLNTIAGIYGQETSWANQDQLNKLQAEQINAGIYDTAVGANTDVAVANLGVAADRDEQRRETSRKLWSSVLSGMGGMSGGGGMPGGGGG
jgi:hypothetical protein